MFPKNRILFGPRRYTDNIIHSFIYPLFLISLICFMLSLVSGCSTLYSSNSKELAFKELPNEQEVHIDGQFLKRQEMAEKYFFGQQERPSRGLPSLDTDDEEAQPDTPAVSGRPPYGGIAILWPTTGTLTSVFGRRKLGRRTRMHAGIDIGAAKETPIKAAASGQILFSGSKRGYGYAVIIGHDGSHETLYAHMSHMAVRIGQTVTQGQLIGFVGRTGHVTGSNLHFETRIQGIAYDPLAFLPPARRGAVRVGEKTPTDEEQLAYLERKKGTAALSF